MNRLAFYDEMGNPQEFIVKAEFQSGDEDYIAILPAEDIESPTFILRVDIDAMGRKTFVGIDDEELKTATKAYEKVKKNLLQ